MSRFQLDPRYRCMFQCRRCGRYFWRLHIPEGGAYAVPATEEESTAFVLMEWVDTHLAACDPCFDAEREEIESSTGCRVFRTL